MIPFRFPASARLAQPLLKQWVSAKVYRGHDGRPLTGKIPTLARMQEYNHPSVDGGFHELPWLWDDDYRASLTSGPFEGADHATPG